MSERERWDGKFVFYPGGVLVHPDAGVHIGPAAFHTLEGASGLYRWEYVGTDAAGQGTGPWVMVGPFKQAAEARRTKA